MASEPPTSDSPVSQYVLPPWQMQIIGLTALLAASGLIIWASTTSSTHFELPAAQCFACIGISLYLAVFFYVFWPQKDLRAPVKAFFATKEFQVAGPILLFFLSFGILYVAVPKTEHEYTEIFSPKETIYYDRNSTVERKDMKQLTYHLIPQSRSAKLEGIYIRFPKGENSIEAVFKHDGKSKSVVFTRRTGYFETTGE